MARSPFVLLAFALILPGCVQEPASSGGTVSDGTEAVAPAWAVGDEWTFRVSGNFDVASGNASMSGERSTRVTWAVVNASAPVADTPAVHVRVDGDDADADFLMLPFFPVERGLWAFDATSLDALAHGRSVLEDPRDCAPDMGPVYGGVPARSGWPLRFPLAPGGAWAMHGADVRVDGWEEVTTAAGTFHAVRVTTTLDEHPVAPSGSDVEWRLTTRHWYAPDARHVVLADAEISQSVRDPSGTRHAANATARVELEAFTRDPAAADEAVPTALGAEWPWTPETRRPTYRIGTDTPVPWNLANGSITARFALVDAPEGTPQGLPGLVVVDDLDAARVELDENATVTWRLESFFADELDHEREGDVFEHAFDAVAEFDLEAVVEQPCLPFDRALAQGDFATSWNATRTVRVDAGEPTPVDVAVVPVKHPFPRGHVTWDFRRDAPGDVPGGFGGAVHGQDTGTLVVYDETGDFVGGVAVHEPTGSEALDLWSAEEYRFVWEPRNEAPLAQGRVNGHEVTFEIRVHVDGP